MAEPSSTAVRAVVRDGTAGSPLLGRLLEELPDVFAREVLAKWLTPTDRALLERACWKCLEAVVAADLETAGDTEDHPFMVEDFVSSVPLLAFAAATGCPWELEWGWG
jgi:hypothetical protein